MSSQSNPTPFAPAPAPESAAAVPFTGGLRRVDAALCIHVGGAIWYAGAIPDVQVGDYVTVAGQDITGDCLGVIHENRIGLVIPRLSASAEAPQPAPAPLAPQPPSQRTAAHPAPGGSPQSTSALLPHARTRGRTGPKPSRPVHSGSVKERRGPSRFLLVVRRSEV